MKTVVHNSKSRDPLLHIEAEGCIINVRVGLRDSGDHPVTSIQIMPDKYHGESWSLPDYDPKQYGQGVNVRVRKDQKEPRS